MFERQWERFSLVHEDILVYIGNDTSAVANVEATFNEQASRRAELLDKISNYLSNKATDNEQIQSSLSKAKSENNLETVSQASFSSSATNMSAKFAASARSVEKRQMRENTELAIRQLRKRQRIERDAELHKLEARQALEQQGLKERLEIAKLEEEYAIEAEQKLCFDEQADLNNIKGKWQYIFYFLI
jgi:hypothetical protein